MSLADIDCQYFYCFPKVILEEAAEMGMTGDMRTGGAEGAFQQPASIDPSTKTRSYAGTAHYSAEIKGRKNLTVLTNTTVKKVLFDTSGPEPVATGVSVVTQDGTEKTLAGSEVLTPLRRRSDVLSDSRTLRRGAKSLAPEV